MASGALGAVEDIKQAGKQFAGGQLGLSTAALGTLGGLTGSKDISKLAGNIEREGGKGIEQYGDTAMDIGANVATGGTYGAAQTAAQSLASGGLKGLLSGKGLQEAALGAAGSYAGIDPNMIQAAQAGLKAAQGDIKGAALQGLGTFGGMKSEALKELGLESLSKLKPEELQKYTEMAKTGVSAKTGDKAGIASGLASQFGAGEDISQFAGALAGGKDLKGAALSKLGSMAGFDPKQLQTGLSALTGDKAGLASGLASRFGAGDMASNLVGQFAGGKGAREVISDQAGAYAEDEANRLFDEQMGIAGASREGVKQIEQQIKDVKRMPTSIAKEAKGLIADQYQIAKGDSFNAIAKKLGVSPEELKAANPNLKDINKIATGAKLNIPGVRDLSGAIERGVVESGKMTAAQFDADKKFQDWMKSQTGYIGKEKKAAMQRLLQDRANMTEDEFQIAESQISRGEIPSKYQVPTSAATQKEESGFFDKVGDFIGDNKGLLGGAAQVAGAGVGYLAGESARKEQKELAEKQLKEVQNIGGKFTGMEYDPTRYKQEKEFLQQRVAGGGVTAEEKKMQQEGDIRAARAAAAQRLAGMEQQARMGAGTTGAGASLASALAGGQAAMSEQSAANLAREASASNRLERDIQRQSQLSRQQTAEEAELAKQQSEFGLQKAQQVGSEREELSRLAAARGKAAAELAGQVTDTAIGAMERVKSSEEAEQADQQKRQAEQDRQYQEQQRQMQLEQQRLDLEAKRKAAQNLAMGAPQQPKPAQPAPAQLATGKPGEGYGVLQSSIGQASSAVQKASDAFNKFNQSVPKQAQPVVQQVGKGIQQAQNVVQQGQKVAQQVQQGVDKAKQTYEQFKNPLKSFFG